MEKISQCGKKTYKRGKTAVRTFFYGWKKKKKFGLKRVKQVTNPTPEKTIKKKS